MGIQRTVACRRPWRNRLASAAVTIAAMTVLLFLDGQLGPLSFSLRRATALTFLSFIAVPRLSRAIQLALSYTLADARFAPLGRAVPDKPTPDRRSEPGRGLRRRARRWYIGVWAAVIVSVAAVARAPSVPIGIVAFVAALAMIEIASAPRLDRAEPESALVPACLSYVAIRFAVELVPQLGAVAGTMAQFANWYINGVRGFDARVSFTALGGPAVLLAVLYILWRWRRVGGVGRLAAAGVLSLAWFGTLPVVSPDVSAGGLAGFSYGAGDGLFWLAIARLTEVVLPHRHRVWRASAGAMPRFSLAAAGITSALAGVCLIGTGLVGSAAGRSIRVHNYGGLDWERPEFGRFGAFSGGMFGLLPVYCIAEGYDFAVIDHAGAVVPIVVPQDDVSAPEAMGESRRPAGKSNVGGLDPPRGSGSSPLALPETASRSIAERAVNVGSNKDRPPRPIAPASDAAPSNSVIEPSDIEHAQILVLINSPKVWDKQERRTIYDFVARGGSLLVLGDHTDVFGLMRGFNSLLGPLGIKFRFDSAYKVRNSWRGCQSAAADAVALGWEDENPGVAVGGTVGA